MKPLDVVEMTSNKPYFIRALYEWIADNNMVPHIVVDATKRNLKIPMQYVENGQIVLNISGTAAQHLQITNADISFSARFSGQGMQVYVPIHAVLAIYARETGQGMFFEAEEDNGSVNPPDISDKPPTFTIVK